MSEGEWERRMFQTLRITCAFRQEIEREKEGEKERERRRERERRGNMPGTTSLNMAEGQR